MDFWGFHMRISAVGLFLMIALRSGQAYASDYYVDLNTVGGETGYVHGPCYCGFFNYYLSPVLTFSPGDTVDFGTVTEYGFGPVITPDAGPNQVPAYGEFLPVLHFVGTPDTTVNLAPEVSFGSPIPTETFDLSFTLGQSTFLSIQVELEGYAYAPPIEIAGVPEPSTWAMLLIGFAGIGVAAKHQRRCRGHV